MVPAATRQAIEAVWRVESTALVAGLARRVHDPSLAEDLAQDVLVTALERWPRSGIPDRPGAWLMATARRLAVDALRREALRDRTQALLREGLPNGPSVDDADLAALADGIDDDVLRLLVMTCHPVLPREAGVALTLRLVVGLSTSEIARAFLVSDAAVAQRIVRAKRTLAAVRVPLAAPGRGELGARLAAVLEVLYVLFGEGHAPAAGERWTRPRLCREALRLNRVLAALLPRDPEVHGLLALMELQASRLGARVGADGEPIPLPRQDRGRWNRRLVRRGLEALARAERLGGALGPYGLQAAIAACHARAPSFDATDWPRIVGLYDRLATLAGSPVVELNRAVAVALACGPQAGLDAVERLADEPALHAYHLLPSVRAELLLRLGRRAEARAAFARAADLCVSERERRLLLARAASA